MGNSKEIVEKIIDSIKNGEALDSIKSKLSITDANWYNYSSKAYNVYFANAKKERKNIKNKMHVSAASINEINDILNLNKKLVDHALLLPIFSTTSDYQTINKLVGKLPDSESEILKIIGELTFKPKLRAIQKNGRFEHLIFFKDFTKLIDAAVLSYYRTNFISCYLTLVPLIEGIIMRWMGYDGSSSKPKFAEIKKFFKNSAQRQPCPYNPLFHDVFSKACHKIFNDHFFKDTTTGDAYASFNRHLASHLLKNDPFANKENCIRLFVLLDSMSEIFVYESRIDDPKFSVRNDQLEKDIDLFATVILENTKETPEQKMFGTSI